MNRTEKGIFGARFYSPAAGGQILLNGETLLEEAIPARHIVNSYLWTTYGRQKFPWRLIHPEDREDYRSMKDKCSGYVTVLSSDRASTSGVWTPNRKRRRSTIELSVSVLRGMSSACDSLANESEFYAPSSLIFFTLHVTEFAYLISKFLTLSLDSTAESFPQSLLDTVSLRIASRKPLSWSQHRRWSAMDKPELRMW